MRVTRKQTLRSLTDCAIIGICGILIFQTYENTIICSLHRLYFIVGVIPKEGLAGPRQSFFWNDNDKDLKVGFLVTHLIYEPSDKKCPPHKHPGEMLYVLINDDNAE